MRIGLRFLIAAVVRVHWNLMRVRTTISSTEVERSIARVYQCVY